MRPNELSPLDKLHQEKAILKQEFSESEDRLSAHWSYIRNNLGSIILSTAVRGIGRQLGIIKREEPQTEEKKSNGFLQGLLGSTIVATPFIWEMVQPMLMGFVMSKIKSLFTRKKKKKK